MKKIKAIKYDWKYIIDDTLCKISSDCVIINSCYLNNKFIDCIVTSSLKIDVGDFLSFDNHYFYVNYCLQNNTEPSNAQVFTLKIFLFSDFYGDKPLLKGNRLSLHRSSMPTPDIYSELGKLGLNIIQNNINGFSFNNIKYSLSNGLFSVEKFTEEKIPQPVNVYSFISDTEYSLILNKINTLDSNDLRALDVLNIDYSIIEFTMIDSFDSLKRLDFICRPNKIARIINIDTFFNPNNIMVKYVKCLILRGVFEFEDIRDCSIGRIFRYNSEVEDIFLKKWRE